MITVAQPVARSVPSHEIILVVAMLMAYPSSVEFLKVDLAGRNR